MHAPSPDWFQDTSTRSGVASKTLHVVTPGVQLRSFIPRPFPPPVRKYLQYTDMVGEGLGDLVMCGATSVDRRGVVPNKES